METENELAESIRQTALKKAYDEVAKKLLSHLIILAWILKACVSEFRECTVDEIAERYILAGPVISSVGVYPDTSGEPIDTSMRIQQTGVEDGTVLEGVITFDIRFHARTPSDEAPVRMNINLEAQNDFYPGYPLVKRGIYYGSRMISSQYGTVFTHSEYDKIEKVYSIWIYTYPPVYCQDAISEYRIRQKRKKGCYKEKKEHYDLMRIIFICLTDPEKNASDGLIRLLSVLLSSKMEAEEKIRILSEEYHIKMTRKMKGEIEEMCNLSQGVWNEGLKQGEIIGEARGEARGEIKGIKDSILLLLGLLGSVPENIHEKVKAESIPSVLNQWLIAARNSNSFDEFEKKI